MSFHHACSFRARNRWQAYLFTCVAVAAAQFGQHMLINFWLEIHIPYLLFYIALTASAWYGGLGPGILATVLGALSSFYFFVSINGNLDRVDFISTGLFLVTGIFISVLFESLARADAALRNADQRKDEFLATLAHELRNPLAPISNAVEILRAAHDEPTHQKTLGIVGRQVRQMTQLVDDLMDVARIAQDKIVLRKSSVLLSEAIADAIENVKPLIAEKKHALSVSLPPEPAWLYGDATRLTQIFANVLNNAAKYTDPGGAIRVEASVKDGMVQVVISDNGIGISPEMLPRIFDIFSQADSRSERGQKGLGIGLSLVQKLVRLHGGDIRAQSQGLGQGSRFSLSFPLAEAPAKATGPGERDIITTHRRVLVVDDSADSAQTLAWMLEPLGCEVRTANSGPEAIEAAKTFLPRIILLDVGMPGMDGYQTCVALRQIESLRDAVIIAQTGYGQREDRQRTADAGFDAHLVKPVSIASLQKFLVQEDDHIVPPPPGGDGAGTAMH